MFTGTGGGGLWLGLSLSHFLLLWVLPLPPLTHLPLLAPAPQAAPLGAGVPEWNHVSGQEQSMNRAAEAGAARSRPERLAEETHPGWG